MSIYERVLLEPKQILDTTIDTDLVKSRFETSGFFTADNLIIHTGDIKAEFEVARPQYNTFTYVLGEQGKLNYGYSGDKGILNVWAANIVREVQSALRPNHFPIISPEMPHKDEMRRMHLQTMASIITTRFDHMMIEDLLGKNYIRKDKNKDGTVNPATEPTLEVDSGRPVKVQQTNLTGMFTRDTGKYLMEELHSALRTTEMARNNKQLYVLMPEKAFLAYWHTFAMSHGASEIVNNTFTCGIFKFVSFATDEFPTPVAGSYGCIILATNTVKFLIPVEHEMSDIIMDEMNRPILNEKGECKE